MLPSRVIRWPKARHICETLLHHAAGHTLSTSTAAKESDGPVCLHVPEKIDLSKFAGKIAAVLRSSAEANEGPIRMKATGTNAVNTAIKSLVVARRYLREHPGIGLNFRVAHEMDADKDRISHLLFAVSATHSVVQKESLCEEGVEEIWVKALANGRSIGGKIAVALFHAEKILMVAVGPRAVGTAVVGITWARRMLHQQGLDVVAIPNMTDVTLRSEYRSVTGVQFMLSRVDYMRLRDFDPEEPFNDTEVSIIDKSL